MRETEREVREKGEKGCVCVRNSCKKQRKVRGRHGEKERDTGRGDLPNLYMILLSHPVPSRHGVH